MNDQTPFRDSDYSGKVGWIEGKSDGGPAFPHDVNDGPHTRRFYGMSLRDWFAGQALSSFIPSQNQADVPLTVVAAYHLADAMLAQREKQADKPPAA